MHLGWNKHKLHFQNNKTIYEALALIFYFCINAFINATSDIMEDARNSTAQFATWEPFVWEYSSAVSSLILFPFIAIYTLKQTWLWSSPLKSFFCYFFASILFSLCHIGMMVGLREAAYHFSPSEYDFAKSLTEWGYELIYELRKDIWSFFIFRHFNHFVSSVSQPITW